MNRNYNTFNRVLKQEMILEIVGTLVLIGLLILFNACWLKPRSLMKFYQQQIKGQKYVAKISPYKFLNNGAYGPLYQGIKAGDPYKIYKEIYPKYDIVLSNMLNKPLIQLCHVDYVKDFFSVDKHYDYPKIEAIAVPFRRLIGGNGIGFAEGMQWKHRKTILNHVMNFQFLVSQIPNIVQVCDNCFQEMEEKAGIRQDADGKFVECFLLEDLMIKIFSQIILTSFFGLTEKHYIEGEEACEFLNNVAVDLMNHQLKSITPFFGDWFYDMEFRKIDKSINRREKALKQWGMKIIREKITKIEAQLKEKNNKIEVDDLVKAVLLYKKQHNLPDSDPLVSEAEIFTHFIGFFLGGTDTTSNYTNMMICYLAKYPEIEKKVREEVEQYMAKNDYSYENLKNFKYIQALQKETTRFYGPGNTLLIRQALKDNYLNGLAIKKGTFVTVVPFANHYSEKFYKDPYQFRPERWLNGECDHLNPFALVGFSAGARTCIGKHLALLQSKIAIIKIMKRYKKITFPKPDFKMQFKFMSCPEDFKTKLTLSEQ